MRKFLEAFGLKEDEDDVFGVREQEQAAKKIIDKFGEDVIEFTEYIAGEYLFTLALPVPSEITFDFSIYNNKAYLSAMSYDDHMDTLSVRYNETILKKILLHYTLLIKYPYGHHNSLLINMLCYYKC